MLLISRKLIPNAVSKDWTTFSRSLLQPQLHRPKLKLILLKRVIWNLQHLIRSLKRQISLESESFCLLYYIFLFFDLIKIQLPNLNSGIIILKSLEILCISIQHLDQTQAILYIHHYHKLDLNSNLYTNHLKSNINKFILLVTLVNFKHISSFTIK